MAIPDETASSNTDEKPFFFNPRNIVLVGILALVLIGAAYSLYSYMGNSPLREYQAQTAEMSMEKMREMSPEDRKQYFENMKNLREKMTDSQKEKADSMMQDRFRTQMTEKMNKFFALSPEEKKVELDKEVDRMASMMKTFGGGKGGPFGAGGAGTKAPDGASGKGQGGAPGSGNPNSGVQNGVASNTNNPNTGIRGGGSPNSGASNGGNAPGSNGPGGANNGNAKGPDVGASKTGGGGPPTGIGGPPWARGNPNASPDQKNKWTSDRLDNSTPEFRAQMTEYFQMVNQRAKEKGIQLPNFGGGPPPARAK